MEAISWHDVVGTIGVVVILVAYGLLQAERLSSRAALYSALNLVGALMILFSLFHSWNTASVLIEIFWIAISLYGLWRAWRRRGQGKPGKGRPEVAVPSP